jgi:arylformamidase
MFSNGGGIQGQDSRLDIDDDDIDDDALADYIIRDLRLLMVSAARILNKRAIEKRRKRQVVRTGESSGLGYTASDTR